MMTSGLANREFAVSEGQRCAKFEADGISVVAIAAAYNDPQLGTGMSGRRRMLKFHQFARLAGRVGRELPRPDVVFATHTPLTAGLGWAGTLTSRLSSRFAISGLRRWSMWAL
jgi:hypothetical protein